MSKIVQAKVSIPFKLLAIAAYSILIIPTLLFFMGWLKWYFGVLFSIILLFGAFRVIKQDYWYNDDKLIIPLIHLILIIIVFSLWVLFSGSCGIGVSNFDTKWRTAILRDLIEFKWPVYYPETGGSLCYYFVFWMVPALFGKFFGIGVAFVIQWIWMLCIILLSFLLIVHLFKDYSVNILWLICTFIILWSGINIFGAIIMDVLGWNLYGVGLHLNEAYCDKFWNYDSFNFYYRSNEDFICESYNQIVIWLAVPLFLQSNKIHNYAFLGLLIFPFSPWGTVGLGILMILNAGYYIIKDSFSAFIKEAFSIQNICAIFSVFFVFVIFFMANTRTSANQQGGFGIIDFNKFDRPRVIALLTFWLCEFGVYIFFLWEKNKKKFQFLILIPTLMFIPLFWAGNIEGRDFCMNVSLPALYILMIYMVEYIKDKIIGKKLTAKHFVLLICLIMAATTPVFDWAAKVKTMYFNKSINIQDDSFFTYSNKKPEDISNQVAANPKEALFYRFFAKSFETFFVSSDLSDIATLTNIDDYFDYLIGKNCTVFIAVQDIPGFSLNEITIDKMKQLGFNDDIDILIRREYHSFIGIVKNGEIVLQQIGQDEPISQFVEIDTYSVSMASATFNTGNYANIIIKGVDYSVKYRGLNIVVRDNITGCIIDSVCFDTHTEEMPCIRK